jgi:CheY-like chemotaxis protein
MKVRYRSDRPIATANSMRGRTVAISGMSTSLCESVCRILSHAGITIVDGQPGSVLVTRDPRHLGRSATIFLRRPGNQRQEDAKNAHVLLLPVTAHELLNAIELAHGHSASILALDKLSCGQILNVSATTLGSSSGTVLLAEDNKVNQMLAVRTLEKAGYRVLVANNGCEAVECMRTVGADVVLMDIQMPEMDGFQATAEIRQWSSVPVIAMTAHALKGDRERCLSGGMTDYISKPVRPAALVQMVEQYMHFTSPLR